MADRGRKLVANTIRWCRHNSSNKNHNQSNIIHCPELQGMVKRAAFLLQAIVVWVWLCWVAETKSKQKIWISTRIQIFKLFSSILNLDIIRANFFASCDNTKKSNNRKKEKQQCDPCQSVLNQDGRCHQTMLGVVVSLPSWKPTGWADCKERRWNWDFCENSNGWRSCRSPAVRFRNSWKNWDYNTMQDET